MYMEKHLIGNSSKNIFFKSLKKTLSKTFLDKTKKIL